ncbi:collagen-binding domain-containing protein [Patulibacter sp. SYSU D01012]|uniref:collagen-binding domain-containing protein n=1 Tax=Patulibacter sp. SYSU D01012 TaxID=2817381 RepID=UPI001B314D88|nr:collagen-binding domain-containing protein [Patulibacter sp. SYSU D01012]
MPSALRRVLRLPALVVVALLVAIGAVTATTWSARPTNAAAAAACTPSPLGAATGWTEFVRGDGRRGSSESEGAVAYGGDLDAQWMTIAMGEGSRGIPGTQPTLVVGGAGGSFNVNRGSAYVRDLRGGLNLNGGAGAKRLASSPLDVAAAFPDLVARSAAWARMPATGTTTIRLVDGFKRFLDLTGTDPGTNVFTVTPDQLVRLEGIHLRTPEGSTALITVVGAGAVPIDGEVDYLTSGGGVVQASDGTHERNVRTLWNLPDATSVTLRIRGAFGGTIVAPNADVTVTDNVGHNLGQVVAKSFASQRETHLNLFAGCLPAGAGDGGAGTTTTVAPTTTTTPTTTVPPTTTTAPTTTVPPTTTTAPTTTVPPTTTTAPTTTVPPATTTTPTTPTVPTTPADPPAASLRVTKTVDAPLAVPGTSVAFTVTARNAGSAPAEDVVVSDLVPVGLTDVRGEGCTVDGQVVRCVAGTLAPGAARTFVVRGTAGLLTGAAEREDQIVPFDAQTDWTLDPGEQRTATLSCGSSALLADGSVRIVDVDHSGAPDRSVVHVLRERIDNGTYEATIVNRSSTAAPAAPRAACTPPACRCGPRPAATSSPATPSRRRPSSTRARSPTTSPSTAARAACPSAPASTCRPAARASSRPSPTAPRAA